MCLYADGFVLPPTTRRYKSREDKKNLKKNKIINVIATYWKVKKICSLYLLNNSLCSFFFFFFSRVSGLVPYRAICYDNLLLHIQKKINNKKKNIIIILKK